MNKTLIAIIVIVAILVVGGVWWMQKSKAPAVPKPGTSSQSQPSAVQQPSDTTASINNQINSVDTGSTLDQGFQNIDQDVNAL